MPLGQIIVFIIGTIAIIFGAYYVTYFIGTKATGQSRGRLRNRNIHLIDRFSVSRDKSFCLVEISGKVYVIGITNHAMTLLDILDAAEFTDSAKNYPPAPQWTAQGGRLANRLTKRLAVFIAKNMGRTLEIEEDEDGDGATFEDKMKASREKNRFGQPFRQREKLPHDPEGDK